MHTLSSGDTRKVAILAVAVPLILISGTVGYMIVEGMSVIEALYMTVITRRRAVRREIDSLRNHYVICGYGRVGEAVARANADETARKLEKVGADHVISPYSIGGKKVATLMLKPLVSDYLEVVTGGGELEFRLEEFALNDTCEIVGRSIGELQVRRRTGATILAVRHRSTGVFDTNPLPDLVLDDGDVLIAIGTPVDIANLEELFACRVPALNRDRYEITE